MKSIHGIYKEKKMKKNKYYTPEIEEFHVGFEYENYYNDIWHSKEFGESADTLRHLTDYPNRVKHLDREDIESLGGVHDTGDCYDFGERWMVSWFSHDGRVEIYDEENENGFSGTIKNKSELKKLLKQLGI
jgi:hypothetical protein